MNSIDFDFNTKEGKIQGYVHMYMLINGVMTLEKIVSILREYHGFDVSENDIKSLVKGLFDISVSGENLIIKDMPYEILNNYKTVKNNIEYKIIDDLDSIEMEYNANVNKVYEVLNAYIDDESIVLNIVLKIVSNGVDKKSLKKAFQIYDVVVGNKDFFDIYKELSVLEKDFRLWIYNGFTINELLDLKSRGELSKICLDENIYNFENK